MIIFISDINDLSLPKTCKIEFPDPDDLLNFKLVIAPDEVHVNSITKFTIGFVSNYLTN